MNEIFKDLFAGSIAGGTGILVGQPLDLIKIRQQASHVPVGAFKVLNDTVREEGVRALYKGLIPPVASQALFNSLSFAGYGFTMQLLEGKDVGSDGNGSSQCNLWHSFLAGCVGGALSTIATTPAELVKIKVQVDHSKESNRRGALVRVLKKEWQAGGIRSFYGGWGITAIRDTPATGVYFVVYYGTKNYLLDTVGSNRTVAELFSGGFAGVVSWLSIIGVDVVKTRVQESNRSMVTCAKELWQEEGMRAFTKGSLPILARAFPVNAVTFFAYEQILRLI